MQFGSLIDDITKPNINPKSDKTVSVNLHMLRMMRAQCLVWYLKAQDTEEVPTMFLLETEIQYLMALEAGVKWALGLGQKNLVHPTRVAKYNQQRGQDEVEATGEI